MSLTKTRTNREVMQRFLEPVYNDPLVFALSSAIFFLWYVFGVFSTLVFAELTSALTQNNMPYFWNILYIFIG